MNTIRRSCKSKLFLVAVVFACVLFCSIVLTACSSSANTSSNADEQQFEVSDPKAGIKNTGPWRLTDKYTCESILGSEDTKLITYSYSDDGLLVREDETHQSDISFDNRYITTYSYNENGDIDQQKKVAIGSSGWYEITSTTNKYDELGRWVGSDVAVENDDGGVTVQNGNYCEYKDENIENPSGYIEYDADGNFLQSVEIDYDEWGNETCYKYCVDENNYDVSQYEYNEHGDLIYIDRQKVRDGKEIQLEQITYSRYYDDKGNLIFSTQQIDTPDGDYFAYDDNGNNIQTLSVEKNQLTKNRMRIYDSNNLLLAEILYTVPGSSNNNDNAWDWTTYEYENVETGQVVSGTSYLENKYFSEYSVDLPNGCDSVIDPIAVYNECLDSDESDSEDNASLITGYSCPPVGPDIVFDSSISTECTTTILPERAFEKVVLPGERLDTPAYSITIPSDYNEWVMSFDANYYSEEDTLFSMGLTSSVYDELMIGQFYISCFSDNWMPEGEYIRVDLGASTAYDGAHVWLYADAENFSQEDINYFAQWVVVH